LFSRGFCLFLHIFIVFLPALPAWSFEKSVMPSGTVNRFLYDQSVVSGKIYRLPSKSASVIRCLKTELIKIIYQEDDWYVVKCENGLVGWVESKILKKDLSNSAQSKTEKASQGSREVLMMVTQPAILRKKAYVISEAVETIKGENRIRLIDTSENWYFVELQSGKRGWIHRNYCKTADVSESFQSQKPDIGAVGVDLNASRKEEIVKILLNSFLPPETFALEGEKPRLICDFFAASLHKDIDREIEVNGDLIKKIRIGRHENPEKKVRIVMDLVPDQEYVVEHIFYKKEKLYTLVIKEKQME
jgi:SH3-like domain-containing protein